MKQIEIANLEPPSLFYAANKEMNLYNYHTLEEIEKYLDQVNVHLIVVWLMTLILGNFHGKNLKKYSDNWTQSVASKLILFVKCWVFRPSLLGMDGQRNNLSVKCPHNFFSYIDWVTALASWDLITNDCSSTADQHQQNLWLISLFLPFWLSLSLSLSLSQ